MKMLKEIFMSDLLPRLEESVWLEVEFVWFPVVRFEMGMVLFN